MASGARPWTNPTMWILITIISHLDSKLDYVVPRWMTIQELKEKYFNDSRRAPIEHPPLLLFAGRAVQDHETLREVTLPNKAQTTSAKAQSDRGSMGQRSQIRVLLNGLVVMIRLEVRGLK